MRKLCPLLILALAACGVAGADGVPPRPRPAPSPASQMSVQLKELSAGNRAFAVNLYHRLRGQQGNLFLSPYSLSAALGMTYAGARGLTERQMARALSFYLPQGELHPAFHALDQLLATRGQGAMGTKGQPFRLHIANALWGQRGYTFLPAFLDLTQRNYGAGLQQVDFAQSEAARGTINNWVSKETEQKITDLIAPGVLNANTRLVLTNAIYFNAAWEKQFRKEATKPGPFTLLDGRRTTVDMMHANLRAGYAARGDWEAVELPYQGREIAMTILLPKPGRFAAVEQSLSAALVEALGAYLQPTEIALAMPKFKYTSSFSLSRTLSRLGMPLAFTPRADFSGMDGKRDLFISEVVHKALVDVNEEGTEAAAATAVVMGITALPPTRPITVTIDRPFLFLIRDLPTGTVLFLGRVEEPKG